MAAWLIAEVEVGGGLLSRDKEEAKWRRRARGTEGERGVLPLMPVNKLSVIYSYTCMNVHQRRAEMYKKLSLRLPQTQGKSWGKKHGEGGGH